MASREQIGFVYVHTDDETGMYCIGEVEGGFNEQSLRNHIALHGVGELVGTLAFMQWQVVQIQREINEANARCQFAASAG